MRCSRPIVVMCGLGVFALCADVSGAKTTVADALRLTPVQSDVQYDRPTEEETAKCRLGAEKIGTASGWIVRGPAGQLLRRFLDTNGDNKVDQWCYYYNGIEVYRDIDGDFNEKADQYRWMGTAGMRWGLDDDEDGRIDRWKVISAEEVTAEVIGALREKDSRRFRRLLLSTSDVQALGLGDQQKKELTQKIQNASTKFADMASRQRIIGPKAQWLDFGGTRPALVPAGTDGSSRDVIIYDNVVAMFETEGKHGQLPIGTLARVGDTWRLIDLPTGLLQDAASSTASSFFLGPGDVSPAEAEEGPAPEGASEKVQELVAQLEKVEAAIANASSSRGQANLGALNDSRADVLTELAQHAKTDEERGVWIRQLADTISAAIQTGKYPAGTRRLATLYSQLDAKSDLAAYVMFRQMSAGYAVSLQDPKADFAKIQEQWLKQLESFVQQYPKAADAAEAMLQLAIAEEFAGNDEKARGWYEKIADTAGTSLLGKKANGALRRLGSVGKPIQLRGRLSNGRPFDLASLKRRIVLIHYWATWCEPCKVDMEVIGELQQKYGKRGFVAVGVNLDSSQETLASFLRQKRLAWPQVYEGGGLDSRLAVELGVFTLPTMILVDPNGDVLNRNIHVTELENELRKRLK